MSKDEALKRIRKAAELGSAALDLSSLALSTLPEELYDLASLKHLRAFRNRLTHFPLRLTEMTSLVVLDLSGNELASVPSEISRLGNLVFLDLANNKLLTLPDGLAALDRLHDLHLAGNQLSTSLTPLMRMKRLAVLGLSRNSIASLPSYLGKMVGLQELWLSENQLTDLPKSLAQLDNLRALDLSHNRIACIPLSVFGPIQLQHLDLSHNHIEAVPSEISLLRELSWLDLGHNRLSSLPAAFFKDGTLGGLNLSGNCFSRLPEQILQLKDLHSLGFADNKLVELPTGIGACKELRGLFLSGNRLSTLPREIGELAQLDVLDLDGNEIERLPEEIGGLIELREFYLSKNKLTSLPTQLGSLEELEHVTLQGNPLGSPPPEVVAQGIRAVLAYLRKIREDREELKEVPRRYQGKLLILGDANEGKTCVSRALQGLEFQQQNTTLGVDVAEWPFTHPSKEGKEITLTIWDFEGQEINHQSHQFFLTQRSLYLLVFSGREECRRARIEYWLDTIKSRAPRSEVILVASQCEDRTPHVPVGELRSRYPNLLQYDECFFPVGCSDRSGINELQEHIKQRTIELEHVGSEWPSAYAESERLLKERAKKKAHISREDLYGIYSKNGVAKEVFDSLGRTMAELGIITQFPDCVELDDFIVLRPQWLTKAISKVMDDKQLETDHGEITHRRLKELWEKDYPGLCRTFHRCMKEFLLSYDLEDEDACMIPLRSGYRKPEIPWSGIPGGKERRIEYRFDATPPAGIMSRLIVKTHYMIAKDATEAKGVYWYNGVFLRKGEPGSEDCSEALCEFDPDRRILSVTVRAAFPQNMIEQLHAFAEAIFNFFPGLKVERFYGCVEGEKEKEERCKGFFSERRINAHLKAEQKILCEFQDHFVRPEYLVYGIGSFGRLMIEEIKEAAREGTSEAVAKLTASVTRMLENTEELVARTGVLDDRVKALPASIRQEFENQAREYVLLMDRLLDDREYNSAPCVVSIVPLDRSAWNPKTWFKKNHVLIPYCEFEGGAHPCEDDDGEEYFLPLTVDAEWWSKTAPKLATAIRVLATGFLAWSAPPVGASAAVLQALKYEAAYALHVAEEVIKQAAASADISEIERRVIEEITGERYPRGAGYYKDFGSRIHEDETRTARMQLAELFERLAPVNYATRKWGPLSRYRVGDGFRWLCKEHAKNPYAR